MEDTNEPNEPTARGGDCPNWSVIGTRAAAVPRFTASNVGFAMRGHESHLGESEKSEAYGQAAVTRTSTGALVGGALGAISALLIPGFGPVLLAGILVMAAGGGLAGGFAGLMSRMQLTDEEKIYYYDELEAGRCLVFVKTGNRYSDALAIFENHGVTDAMRTST